MFDVLYQYLILQKSLSLPGLGTIRLQHIPAISNISDHVIEPPCMKAVFDDTQDTPNKSLFQFLSNRFGIEEWEAIKKINDFSFDLKNELKQQHELDWKHLGLFRCDLAGIVTLESKPTRFDFVGTVPARRVIRANANHNIVRGDKEVTEVFNVSETEPAPDPLTHKPGNAGKWWIWALVLFLAVALTLGIHFYINGVNFDSLFNTQKQPTTEAPKTYTQP